MEHHVSKVALPGPQPISNNPPLLFVGGLPLHACDTNLAKYFRQFGPLDYVEVHRFQNGKSKGTGFIQFVNPSDSRKAVIHSKQHEIFGKKVTLEIASLPESLNFEMKLRTNRKIFIGSIPPETSKEAIYNLLSRHARVERVTHLRTAAGNYTYCYAVLYNYAEKQQLISKGTLLLDNGVPIQVKQYEPKFAESKLQQPTSQNIKQQPSSLTDKAWSPGTPISPIFTTSSNQAKRQEPNLASTVVAKVRPGLELTKTVPQYEQISKEDDRRILNLKLQPTKATLPSPEASPKYPQDQNYRFNVCRRSRQLTMLL